jgi:putative endopeptidase
MRFGLLGVSVAALMMAVPSLAADKPAIGDFGFDAAGMDRSVKPGDSFFDFANGTYMQNLVIPEDKAGYGVGTVISDQAREQTRAIIEASARENGAAGSDSQKVGDWYASFMDEAGIESSGMAPIKPLLDALANIGSTSELSRAIGEAERHGVRMPLGFSVQTDSKNPDAMILDLSQSGLTLPERDYYLDRKDPKFAQARAAMVDWAAALMSLAGLDNARPRAEAVLALETKLAEVHWTPEDSRIKEKTYNPVMRAELAERFKGLDWDAYLDATGAGALSELVLSQDTAVQATSQLIASEPLAVWKDYLALRTLASAAAYLPKAVVDANFELAKTLSGAKVMRPRWQRGVDSTSGALGEVVGKLYVENHFPAESKVAIDALVKNVIKALDARLENLAWMDPETRAVAREKLTKFTPKIGYPDKWRDYAGLEVVKGDLLGNVRRAARFAHDREIAKLGQPIDRSEWFMAPMVVNAYAYPEWVEIVFPAAILQAPYFDANADAAINYGAIGSIIGHEIIHHFDDQGRKYDKTGKLADWWTPEDVKNFEDRAKALVAQYGSYEALPGKFVNGELTLGENIADMAGLVVAFDAWKASLGGKPAPVIDGFTGEQRFFLGFAQAWRSKYREPIVLQILSGDPHTPSEFRPNTVRNMDAWYEAFGVKPGDKLYLAPEKRVKLW